MAMGLGLMRFLISLFHVSLFIGAAFYVCYSLLRWGTEDMCFPPMAQVQGDEWLRLVDLKTLCNVIYMTFGCVAFLNVAMGVLVNFFWGRKGIMALNLLMSLLIGGYFAFIGAMFTMYRLVWCSTLQQRMHSQQRCFAAVVLFDEAQNATQLTAYDRRLKVEMVGLLSLIPPSFLCVLFYGIVLNISPDARHDYEPFRSDSRIPVTSSSGSGTNDEPEASERTSLLVN